MFPPQGSSTYKTKQKLIFPCHKNLQLTTGEIFPSAGSRDATAPNAWTPTDRKPFHIENYKDHDDEPCVTSNEYDVDDVTSHQKMNLI